MQPHVVPSQAGCSRETETSNCMGYIWGFNTSADTLGARWSNTECLQDEEKEAREPLSLWRRAPQVFQSGSGSLESLWSIAGYRVHTGTSRKLESDGGWEPQ